MGRQLLKRAAASRLPPRCLLDDTAGNAGAASPEGFRPVGIVVLARVNHERAAAHVLHSELRRQDRKRRLTVRAHHKHREVALMTTGVIGTQVLTGMFWVVVSASGEARCHLAFMFCKSARPLVMNVETMNTGR